MRSVFVVSFVLPAIGLCSGCSDSRHKDVDVSAAAARAQGDIANYAFVSKRSTSGAGSPHIAAAAADTMPEAAAGVVRRYYALIAARRYPAARGLWGKDGAVSGVDEAGFAARFDRYPDYKATIGTPGSVDSGAGQLHIAVPVAVAGTVAGGMRFTREGVVLLHRVNDGTPTPDTEEHLWRIESVSVEPAMPPAAARHAHPPTVAEIRH